MKYKKGDWVTIVKILEKESTATIYAPCIGIAAQIVTLLNKRSVGHDYLLDINGEGIYDVDGTGWFKGELRKATEEEIKKAKSNRVAEML